MNDGDRLKELLTTAQPARPSRKRSALPRPSIDLGHGGIGEAVVVVADPKDTADEVAAIGIKMGLPVALLDITKVKAYGNPDSPMYSVHASVQRTGGGTADSAYFNDLLKRVRRRKARKKPEQVGDRTLVTGFLSDAQVGKGDPDQQWQTWEDAVGHLEDRIDELHRAGKPVDTIYATGGGDATEGCGGNPNYPGQDRMVTLNETQQVEFATEMLQWGIDRLSRKVGRFLTSTVSSNHDANRDGKDYPMGREDCRAFTVWRSVARAFRMNEERYGHVEFWLPDDPDVAVVDLHGIGVATIHGDLATRSPANVADKMWAWWAGQLMGGLPAGECQVLNTNHFHHYFSKAQQGKRLFGHPALDVAGSKHYADRTGIWSYPGLLSYVVDANGVSDECLKEFG